MPATVTDTHDHFTELFGTKRGADRPEEDISAGLEVGVPCAGGCGARVMSVSADEQLRSWYCGRCFVKEGEKRWEEALRAQNTPALNVQAKTKVKERRLAQKERTRQVKRRERECFFSRLRGHKWGPGEDRDAPDRCVGCGKERSFGYFLKIQKVR